MACPRLPLLDELASRRLFGTLPDFTLYHVGFGVLVLCLTFVVLTFLSIWIRPRHISIWKLDVAGFLSCTCLTVAHVSVILLLSTDADASNELKIEQIFLIAILFLSFLLFLWFSIRVFHFGRYLTKPPTQGATLKMKAFLITAFLILGILTVAFYLDKMRMSCVTQSARIQFLAFMVLHMCYISLLYCAVRRFWLNWTSDFFLLPDGRILERSKGSGQIRGFATKRSNKMRELVERWI